jgi:6-phosphogluconolactonase
LLRAEIPWARVVVVWGDERGVGPDHPHSNYRMARETLLDLLPRPPLAVLRMEGELDPPEAADRYESALARLFPGEHAPSIDLILLGMGADGHVASLFPGSPALEERERWVAAVPGPGGEGWRLTLTPPVLEAARALLLVGVGKDKAGAYTRAFRGGAQAPALPLERLAAARPDLVVVCDAAAAGSEA